jgi:hypothetical protein
MTSQDATINRGRFEPSEFLFLIRIQRKHFLLTYLELATGVLQAILPPLKAAL